MPTPETAVAPCPSTLEIGLNTFRCVLPGGHADESHEYEIRWRVHALQIVAEPSDAPCV